MRRRGFLALLGFSPLVTKVAIPDTPTTDNVFQSDGDTFEHREYAVKIDMSGVDMDRLAENVKRNNKLLHKMSKSTIWAS